MQWSKLYGTGTAASDAQAQAVVQTTDGGYAFAGYISNFGGGDDDYYLVKTNATGDTVFTRTYGGSGADDASGIAQTTDSGFVISGWTNSFRTNGGGFAYYVKTDANGHTGTCGEYNTGTAINSSITFYAHRTATQVSSGGVDSSLTFAAADDGGTMLNPCATLGIDQINASTANVSVYPVPFSTEATVKISNSPQLNDGAFVMYDAMGREINRIAVSGEQEFNIQGGNLANGVYFYQLLSGTQVLYNGKVMIAH
jgi:hypothetical protein